MERAIAFGQQHRDSGGARIRHDEVGSAVAVEVTHGNRLRVHSHAVVDGVLERAIPFAQQHRDTAVG